MTAAAWELVSFIERKGGRFAIEGDELVIRPGDAAMPVINELRQHKTEIIALLQSRTANPDELLHGEWLLEECVFIDARWGGIGALYLSLAHWSARHGRPLPKSRAAFVTALQAEGFQVTSDGLVYGLVLKSDVACALEQRRSHEQPLRPADRR
jgi:hypothetical protein